MPSWLWRAWLGPPLERGPRGLLGRRPRRLLRPPPPPGRPGPCPPPCPDAPCPPEPCPDPPPCPCPADPLPAFIVLSKPAGPGFTRYRRQTSTLSGSPLVAAGSNNVGAQPLSSGVTPLTTLLFPESDSLLRSGDTDYFHDGIARWAGRNRKRNCERSAGRTDNPAASDANSYWRKKLINCAYRYPYRSPSRRRERPGARKAYAGTRPMRTT
jgi:hypothetical protein